MAHGAWPFVAGSRRESLSELNIRIIVVAYACAPDEGSEPGAGWMWARALARLGEVTVVTRANNRGLIESKLSHTPERDSMQFIYVDLPPWARRWKKGRRGIHLYYGVWLLLAAREGRKESRKRRFDFVWHLTLANIWFGTSAGLIGAPLVYGPVGGGVGAPWRLLQSLGTRGMVHEVLRALVRSVARFVNPFARLSWRAARIILVQNPETEQWIPRRHRHKAHLFPNPVVDELLTEIPTPRAFSRVAVFAGSLLPLKGVNLAIQALGQAPGWSLHVYGAGRDEARLRRLADDLHLGDRVIFKGWVNRTEVLRALATSADVLLFPSLHEEGGWVVAEAAALGLPVICFDRGGPPVLLGDQEKALIVPLRNRADSVDHLASALLQVPHGHQRGAASFTLASTVERLSRLLHENGLLSSNQLKDSYQEKDKG